MRKETGQTPVGLTGRRDGHAARSMMSMQHLAEKAGMFAMMMDIHCININ